MLDREKVIKGLECCKTEDCSYCPYMDTSAPIGKFGTDELIACRPVLYDDCISLLKEQDKIIAALQCALDQANEKLAYVSGEECYHYDCEAGREQLEEWWEALFATADVEPVRHGRWIDYRDTCSECGQYVYHGDSRNYCPNCGAKMDLEEDDG